MIVRARRKPIEEIPEKYLCCEARIKALSTQVIREVEIRVEGKRDEGFCGLCQTVIPGPVFVEDDGVIPIECYDLDEGVRDDH